MIGCGLIPARIDDRYVYHGTNEAFLPSITSDGLKSSDVAGVRRFEETCGSLIYMTRGIDLARLYAWTTVTGSSPAMKAAIAGANEKGLSARPIVLRIDTRKVNDDCKLVKDPYYVNRGEEARSSIAYQCDAINPGAIEPLEVMINGDAYGGWRPYKE